MEGLQIKKLEVADVVGLREVAVEAYSDHYLSLWYDQGNWYLEKYFSIEKLRDELSDQNARFYLAFHNTEGVGFLKLNIDASLPGFDGSALEIERIYLKKAASGKGIGRQLVNLAEEVAAKHNKGLIWLKAMDTSEGPIAFYEKMGFKIIGTHVLRHPLMKEELRGMVLMVKFLHDPVSSRPKIIFNAR